MGFNSRLIGDQDLPLFSFSSLQAATDYFSGANKLGEGGFGSVYKVYIFSFLNLLAVHAKKRKIECKRCAHTDRKSE